MCPDSRWRDVPCLRDIALCHPLPLLLPRFVKASCGELDRMDARRHAALFGLLRGAPTSRFSDDNDRQNHLSALACAFASALSGASESAPA